MEFGHRGRSEVVHERGTPQYRQVLIIEPEDAAGVDHELRAAATVTAHVRRLEVDEVCDDGQRVVERAARQDAMGLRLEGEHGVPRLHVRQVVEPLATVDDEQVGEHRVVRARAPVARRVEGVVRREQSADRLHVMAEVHDAHRNRDGLPLHVVGVPVAVPTLKREPQRLAHAGVEVEPLHEHVGHLAPG